ncbi:MAG: hypothetical protein ACM3WP_05945 [Acidobacteriota bacterium]
MPVEQFRFVQQPEDPEAVIWRFMRLWKFQDLVATSELYFCRSDRLGDDNEGLPPAGFMPDLGLNPQDVHDALKLDHHIEAIAEHRECYFVNCWYLAAEPTAAMWQKYGKDGVAIASRYSLLKRALDAGKDRAFVGVVRYGSDHLRGRWNLMRFIFSKREEFAHEQELRALLYFPDEFKNEGRYVDEKGIPHRRPLTDPPDTAPKFKRLAVDLRPLITEIEISPWASDDTFTEAQRLARANCDAPVRWSPLNQFKELIGTEQDLRDILRARSEK